MHENLKYTVRLDSSITECADIKDTESLGIKDWQPIFADQEYGTFYFLYAKLLGEKEEDGNSFTVQKIQLYLQNFEGEVTIGLKGKAYFYSQELDFADVDPRYPGRKQYGLFIILQGFNNTITTVAQSDIVFPNADQGWTENPEINNGDVLVTRVFFQPIDPSLRLSPNTANPLVLDRLFQARDGDSIVEIERQSREEIDKLHKCGIISQQDYDEIFDGIPVNFVKIKGIRRRCSPIISFLKVENFKTPDVQENQVKGD